MARWQFLARGSNGTFVPPRTCDTLDVPDDHDTQPENVMFFEVVLRAKIQVILLATLLASVFAVKLPGSALLFCQ